MRSRPQPLILTAQPSRQRAIIWGVKELPRLLLCCFDVVPAPTAVSDRLTDYLKGLSERYQVVVLSVKTPDHPHIERYRGARLLRVPIGSGDLAARLEAFDRAVRRQLESEEYVMVHFFDPFGGYALCERRGEFGYKLVYDACSLASVTLPSLIGEAEINARFMAKVRRLELFCLMNADAVIVADEPKRDLVAQLGVDREQLKILPPPEASSLELDAAKVRADLVAIYVALSGAGARFVGDAETASPDEVTQLGPSVEAESESESAGANSAAVDPPSATNKVKADPESTADTWLERPAVMGVPLDEPPIVAGYELPLIPEESAPPADASPFKPALSRAGLETPAPTPAAPVSIFVPPLELAKPETAAEEEDEVEEIVSGEFVQLGAEESAGPEDSPVMTSEESVLMDSDPSPPPSAIDPWLAQLVHGYCPPESGLFDRHTPPTTMPGREP